MNYIGPQDRFSSIDLRRPCRALQKNRHGKCVPKSWRVYHKNMSTWYWVLKSPEMLIFVLGRALPYLCQDHSQNWMPTALKWSSYMAVARNFCVGRQGRRALTARVARGVWGHALPEIFEIQKPWNAIYGSHLFLPDPGDDFSTVIIYNSVLKTPQTFKYVFWFLVFFNGDFLAGGGGALALPLATAMS